MEEVSKNILTIINNGSLYKWDWSGEGKYYST